MSFGHIIVRIDKIFLATKDIKDTKTSLRTLRSLRLKAFKLPALPFPLRAFVPPCSPC